MLERVAVWRVACFVVVAVPALASAQPAPDDPPAPPTTPAPSSTPPAASKPTTAPDPNEFIDPSRLPIEAVPVLPPYPRSFVDRPVVLPRDLYEATLEADVGRESQADFRVDYLGAGVRGAIGLDPFELAVRVDLDLAHHANQELAAEIATVQRTLASLQWRLPADSYMGVQAVIGNVNTRRQRYSPSLFVGHKFRPSETGAVFVDVGVDYNYGNELDGDVAYVSQRFSAYAGGAALLQVTPELALRVGATLAQYKYIDDFHTPANDSYRTISGSGAVLLSASQTVDVSLGVTIASIGAVDNVSGGVSVTVRSR